MEENPATIAVRLVDALAPYPTARDELAAFATDAVLPDTLAGKAALARQLLGAVAPHLTDPRIRRLARALGAYAETERDIDLVAMLGSQLVQLGRVS